MSAGISLAGQLFKEDLNHRSWEEVEVGVTMLRSDVLLEPEAEL